MTKDSYDIICKAMSNSKRIKFDIRGETIIAEPHFTHMGTTSRCVMKIVADVVDKKRDYFVNEMDNIIILDEVFSPDMEYFKLSNKHRLNGTLLSTVDFG